MSIIIKNEKLYDTIWDMYVDEFEDFEPITEQEVADMFGISLEQLIKEWSDGIIECIANQNIDMEFIDKFNNAVTGYLVRVDEQNKNLI